jgi:hypothetical protein
VLDVALTPPAGRERVFAVWSAEPGALPLAELSGLTEGQAGEPTRSYRATRDMVKVAKALAGRAHGSCQAAVVELDHVERGPGPV